MAGILPLGGGSSALEQYAALLQANRAGSSESTGGTDQLTTAALRRLDADETYGRALTKGLPALVAARTEES